VSRRIVGLLGAVALLVSACGGPERPRSAAEAEPPEVPPSLTDQQAFTGITLPEEFDLDSAKGFRTVHGGADVAGARHDSWDLMGDRLATLWRDDAGAEYVTVVELDGTPVWHTQLPELLDPAGERPLEPILERVVTLEGPDWLVVTNIGSDQPAGPVVARVLTLNADTGESVLDVTLPSDRVAVDPGVDHLSASLWSDENVMLYTLLLDLQTGEQQRFDNPEPRIGDWHFSDTVTGFYDDKPIYSRACRRYTGPPKIEGISCPHAVLYDGQEYDSRADFMPLPDWLLVTQAGQRLAAEGAEGIGNDLPCRGGTTRGTPESPTGRYVVYSNNLVDLDENTTICGDDSLWWTAVDDGGRGWGRLEGTTTLRVTYDFASRSVTSEEVPGVETPVAITKDRQGLFAVAGETTDVVLLAPQS
jgi:hypothetical protein